LALPTSIQGFKEWHAVWKIQPVLFLGRQMNELIMVRARRWGLLQALLKTGLRSNATHALTSSPVMALAPGDEILGQRPRIMAPSIIHGIHL